MADLGGVLADPEFGSDGFSGGLDLLPVPLLPTEPSARSSLARRCRQRIQRRCAVVEDANACISALNWMSAGQRGVAKAAPGEPTRAQRQVQERVLNECVRCQPGDDTPTTEEAVRALLHGASVYEAAGVNVAPYRRGMVSLPAEVRSSSMAADLLPDHARSKLVRFHECMLREEAEVEALRREGPEVNLYMDRILETCPKAYYAFIEDLDRRGFIHWSRQRKERVTPFFVTKSGGKLRLILDARRVNQRFADPPGVALCSGEAFSRIEVEKSWFDDVAEAEEATLGAGCESVYTGKGDVKDCFHRLRVGREFAEYFGLDPCPGWVSKLEQLDGVPVDRHELLYPCWGSLAMGFSWSLFFAQEINTYQVQQSGLVSGKPATDRGDPMVFGPTHQASRYYIYVDNVGVLGPQSKQVTAAVEGACDYLDAANLSTHERQEGWKVSENLGVVLDGEKLCARPTEKRYWRIRLGLRWLLRRRRTTGALVERFLGHCTFLAMINRRLLAVFHSVYGFVRRHYQEPVRLWESARRELEAFLGLMPLLRSDWARPWATEVSATDASLSGYGACSSEWDRQEVARHGRVSERSRFRTPGAENAREHALVAHPLAEENYVGVEDDLENVARDFPEVDPKLLEPDRWRTLFSGPFHYDEPITIKEGRAVLLKVRRDARTRLGHNRRRLYLLDNMGLVLALDRCRAKSFALLNIVRQWCSLSLACNSLLAVRWIPSELNVADKPSRQRDRLGSSSSWAAKAAPQRDEAEAGAEPAARPEDPEGAQGRELRPPGAGAAPRGVGRPAEAEGAHAGGGGAGGSSAASIVAKAEEQDALVIFGRAGYAASASASREGEAAQASSPRLAPEAGGQQLDGARGDGRRREVHGELPAVRGEVQEVGGPPGLGAQEGGAGGPGHGRVLHEPVSSRARRVAGREDAGGVGRPLPALRPVRPGQPAARRPESAWVAAHDAEAQPEAHPLPDGGRTGVPHGGDRLLADGSMGPSGLQHLHAPLGEHEPAEEGSSAAMRRCEPTLVLPDLPGGRGGAHEDGRCRCQHRVGRRRSAVDVDGLREAEGWRAKGPAVELRLRRVDPSVQADGGAAAAHGSGAVCVEAFRTRLGPAKAAARTAGHHEERPVAERGKPGTLREARQADRRHGHVQPRPAAVLHRCRATTRGSVPRQSQAASAAASLPRCHFIDAFSGVGGVARAVRRRGFVAREYDIEHGPQEDLTDERVLRPLERDLRAGRAMGLMLGTPCTTFSRARDRTAVIRDRFFPWGKPGVSDKDAAKLKVGNACLRASLKLIRCALKGKVPFIMENPWSSKIWLVPEVQELLKLPQVHFVRADFCCFGTPWKKPTGFMCGNLDWSDLQVLDRQCCGTPPLCGRTGSAHFQLTGSGPGGVPWTRIAQPYPRQLCAALGKIFVNSAIAQLYNSDHLR